MKTCPSFVLSWRRRGLLIACGLLLLLLLVGSFMRLQTSHRLRTIQQELHQKATSTEAATQEIDTRHNQEAVASMEHYYQALQGSTRSNSATAADSPRRSATTTRTPDYFAQVAAKAAAILEGTQQQQQQQQQQQ